MSNPVSLRVGDVVYEFKPEYWLRVTAGLEDAPLPVMRSIIAEQKLLIEELRSRARELEAELLKALDENVMLRLKRGKGRKAP